MLVPPPSYAQYHFTISLLETDGDNIRVPAAISMSGLRTPTPSNPIASVYLLEQPSNRGEKIFLCWLLAISKILIAASERFLAVYIPKADDGSELRCFVEL